MEGVRTAVFPNLGQSVCWLIDGGAGILKNALDGRRKGPDGVHERVVVVVLGYRDVLFVIFLILKDPGDSLGFFEVGIVEV